MRKDKNKIKNNLTVLTFYCVLILANIKLHKIFAFNFLTKLIL